MDQQTTMNAKILDDSAVCERRRESITTCEIAAGGDGLEGEERSAEARARLKGRHARCAKGLSAQGWVRHALRLGDVPRDRWMPLPHAISRVLLGLVS